MIRATERLAVARFIRGDATETPLLVGRLFRNLNDYVRRAFLRSVVSLSAMFVLFIIPVLAADAKRKVDKIVGANACAECHKDEAAVWKGTHHFSTFRKMPRSKEARDIAGKLKIKRIKSDALCAGCHFTQKKVKKTH